MLEKTWRWFGPNDKISLDYLVQMGVEGVVTALHHLPIGVVWEKDEIMKLKKMIESKGLRWSVVESLPVSEDIKTKGKNYTLHIENYKKSLKISVNAALIQFVIILCQFWIGHVQN